MPKKMIKKRRLIIIFSLVLFFIFLSISFLFAQEPRKLEVDYPEIFDLKPETIADIETYLKYIFNFSVFIIGLILFASLIRGGFLYLTSAGNVAKMKEARDQITSAFFGAILLLSGYIILYTINPQLVIFRPFFIEKITPPERKEPPPLKDEEISLIVYELPLGQIIKNGVWSEERETKTLKFLNDFENFLKEKIEINEEFNRISDMVKYLKSLTDECQCQNLKGLATKTTSFGMPIDCVGDLKDLCLEKTAKKIEKIKNEIIPKKIKKLSEFQEEFDKEYSAITQDLARMANIETEIADCLEGGSIYDRNEYLALLDYFSERNWKLEVISLPNVPAAKDDSFTFYCSKGGTIFDYPYYQKEVVLEEIVEVEVPEEVGDLAIQKIYCPVEISIDEFVDTSREEASSLILDLKILRDLIGEMIGKMEKMRELVSKCNDKNCEMSTNNIPNPCYPCPNCLGIACSSPALQTIGGCFGSCSYEEVEEIAKKLKECIEKKCSKEEIEKIYQELEECDDACPRKEIALATEQIKATEDEIFQFLRDTQEIFPRIYSLKRSEEDTPVNLSNLEAGLKYCYSADIEEPVWKLLSCPLAIGNYGPGGQIIEGCNPRTFFCCNVTGEKVTELPGHTPSKERLITRLPKKISLPAEGFGSLLAGADGCPEGWSCDPGIGKQYKDEHASEPLKKLLACMRKKLDGIEKENELKYKIGRISSISDNRLYTGACDWLRGGRCDHTHGLKISCHYGGRKCTGKSYAVDIGDEKNHRYIKKAVEECRPDAYYLFGKDGHYDHIHISIGASEGCGCN